MLGWVVAYITFVSAPVPLGLIRSLNIIGLDVGLAKRFLGLRVWGQGLTIMLHSDIVARPGK